MLRPLGTTELVVIFIILLVLFGGKKLPELGRRIGEAIKKFGKPLESKKA